ncbi:hypothetical protein P7K49_015841, partial [Saguinus oedipus]
FLQDHKLLSSCMQLSLEAGPCRALAQKLLQKLCTPVEGPGPLTFSPRCFQQLHGGSGVDGLM